MSSLPITKTYKLFIGGKFPRTESGATYEVRSSSGELLANMCAGSKKDFRNSVVAARKAADSWAAATPFLRSQILYRIAEMLQGRSAQFVEELVAQGCSKKAAATEVADSIDLWVHYAGWCDKFSSIFSSVNPVASSHFNFSVPEPIGVAAIVAPESTGLLGLCSAIAPVIAGGNACVALASQSKPLCAITLAEVIATSDVPDGVINLLTGDRSALLATIASHRDVDSLLLCSDDRAEITAARIAAADNLKRVTVHKNAALVPSPDHIMAHQELKTTWHPVA